MGNYRKNIIIGECDYNGRGENDCTAEVRVEIRDEEDRPVLSVCGSIYRTKSKHVYAGGQCLDRMLELIPSAKMREIHEIWKRWHLNDLHTACEHHREFELEPYEKHRGHVCEICGYEYGTAWNYEKLPQEVIDAVKAW